MAWCCPTRLSKRVTRTLWPLALDVLAPCHCTLCELPSNRPIELCTACESDLPWLAYSCQSCALPLASNDGLCGECLREPPSFDATVAAVAFAGPVPELVHALKYGGQLPVLPVLTEILAQTVVDHLAENAAPDVLVPMPMHWHRRLRRGFNQAQLLAAGLKKHPQLRDYQLVVDRTACRRTRPTPPQRGLNARQRRANLSQALTCERPLDGLSVAVIDDVMTTGASVAALATALKAAGARRVEAWCCARTLRPA